MTSRCESRTRAYHYVVERAQKVNWDLAAETNRKTADAYFISLDDLTWLKEGLSDPSRELVAVCKQLFRRVASEAEIDSYLATPFLTEK